MWSKTLLIGLGFPELDSYIAVAYIQPLCSLHIQFYQCKKNLFENNEAQVDLEWKDKLRTIIAPEFSKYHLKFLLWICPYKYMRSVPTFKSLLHSNLSGGEV